MLANHFVLVSTRNHSPSWHRLSDQKLATGKTWLHPLKLKIFKHNVRQRKVYTAGSVVIYNFRIRVKEPVKIRSTGDSFILSNARQIYKGRSTSLWDPGRIALEITLVSFNSSNSFCFLITHLIQPDRIFQTVRVLILVEDWHVQFGHPLFSPLFFKSFYNYVELGILNGAYKVFYEFTDSCLPIHIAMVIACAKSDDFLKLRKTKLVCIIRPLWCSLKDSQRLAFEMMSVARFDMCHNMREWLWYVIRKINKLMEEKGFGISVMFDAEGTQRVVDHGGSFSVNAKEGSIWLFSTNFGGYRPFTVQPKGEGFSKSTTVGDELVVDGGMASFRVIKKIGNDLQYKCTDLGLLRPQTKLNCWRDGRLVENNHDLPTLLIKDWFDIYFGISKLVDLMVMSFVNAANATKHLKNYLSTVTSKSNRVLAKIESLESLQKLEEIVKACDGILAARDDLGVEILLEQIPAVPKKMIQVWRQLNKSMIIAYKQSSVQFKATFKLSPRFYGSYPVLQKIGAVAYKIALPPSSRIHPVFYVSLLKTKLGSQVVPQSLLPAVSEAGTIEPVPVAVLDRRLVKLKGRPATELLIQWSNSFPEDATWEFYSSLKSKFPTFEPCGQGSSEGRGNDTHPNSDPAGVNLLATRPVQIWR